MQGNVLNVTPAGARTIAWLPLMVAAGAMLAVATTRADTPAPESQSPWLLVPTLVLEPEARHLIGRDGRLHVLLRPTIEGVPVWRQRAIYVDRFD